MNILIAEKTTEGQYTSLTIIVETRKINILQAPGYVNVKVNNASQIAWKGFGKDFQTFEQAIENYKDVKVKAAIHAAQIELN